MDYLFGIVVLLCGVVQAGRGAKPKHNVPRLKLSYKGKPPAPSPGHTEQRWCFQSSLSSLFLASGCSFMLSFSCTLSCLECLFFLSSISVNLFLPVSLIHSSILVSKQHLTLCLTSFIPLCRALSSVLQNSLFF